MDFNNLINTKNKQSKHINMKKKWFTIMTLATMLFLHAQKVHNIIKMYPSGFIYGPMGAMYERTFSAKSSFAIGVSFLNYYIINGLNGVALDMEYRIYPLQSLKIPAGLYLAPFVGVHNVYYHDIENGYFERRPTKKYVTAGVGGKAGYQLISDTRMVLDFFVGYGVNVTPRKGYPVFGIAMGYGF